MNKTGAQSRGRLCNTAVLEWTISLRLLYFCHPTATMFCLKRCLVTTAEFGCTQRGPDDATWGASAGRQDGISHLSRLRLLQKICFGLFKLPTVSRPLKSVKCNKHNCHFASNFDGGAIATPPREPAPRRLHEAACLAIFAMSNTWIIRVAAPRKNKRAREIELQRHFSSEHREWGRWVALQF